MSQHISDELIFDPRYQSNMLLIDAAMRETGLLQAPAVQQPDIFDEQLRKLIESVTLE